MQKLSVVLTSKSVEERTFDVTHQMKPSIFEWYYLFCKLSEILDFS